MKKYDLKLGGVQMHPMQVATVNCLVEDEGLRRNVAATLARGLPSVQPGPAKPGRLAIVGSGPSVREHLAEIDDGFDTVWAINGAFCWLIENGIVPSGFVCLDPDKDLESLLPQVPNPGPIYYLAAICDSSLFEHVLCAGGDVRVWFSYQHRAFNSECYPVGTPLIKGGTTCLTRAPFLAHALGWRDMTIFGGDSSFDNGTHCYEEGRFGSVPSTVKLVRVGDKVFETNTQMMHQVANFIGFLPLFGDMLKFRVGGLLGAMLDAPTVDIEVKELENADGQEASADA